MNTCFIFAHKQADLPNLCLLAPGTQLQNMPHYVMFKHCYLVLLQNIASEWTVKRIQPISFLHGPLSCCTMSLGAHLSHFVCCCECQVRRWSWCPVIGLTTDVCGRCKQEPHVGFCWDLSFQGNITLDCWKVIGEPFEVLWLEIPQAHFSFDRPVIALSLSHQDTSRFGSIHPQGKAGKTSLRQWLYLKRLCLCVLSVFQKMENKDGLIGLDGHLSLFIVLQIVFSILSCKCHSWEKWILVRSLSTFSPRPLRVITQRRWRENLRHAKHSCVRDWLQTVCSSELHSQIETMAAAPAALAYKKQQQQL